MSFRHSPGKNYHCNITIGRAYGRSPGRSTGLGQGSARLTTYTDSVSGLGGVARLQGKHSLHLSM